MSDKESTKSERVKKFLADYARLCEKYRIAIGGCGCCGSPFLLLEDDSSDPFEDDLNENIAHYIRENIDYIDKDLAQELKDFCADPHNNEDAKVRYALDIAKDLNIWG